MDATGGMLGTTRAATPRWRTIAVATAVVATLIGSGFAAGRATAPDLAPIDGGRVATRTEVIRPGRDRGQARFGDGLDAPAHGPLRPANHAGGRVKGG
jgi:hypothetical protein